MFVPERVMTLIEPPEAPPDSAERPLVTTWNSCTISGDSSVRLDPVYSTLLSSPSMDTLLLRGRRPPNVKPLPVSGVEPLTTGGPEEIQNLTGQHDPCCEAGVPPDGPSPAPRAPPKKTETVVTET